MSAIRERTAGIALWASIIVAPLVFLGSLSLAYALVPFACKLQSGLALDVTLGAALAFTLAALVSAWRARGEATARRNDVDRLLATVGISVSALSALAIAAQWGARWMLMPCLA
jgi:hypothetical protein